MNTGQGRPPGPPPGNSGLTPPSPRPAPTATHQPAPQPMPPDSPVPENPLKPNTLIFGATVVVIALVAGLFVVTQRGDTTESAGSALLGNEVFLEPAQSIGTDPFFAETADLVAVEPVLIPVDPAPAGLEISSANDGQSIIEADAASATQASNGATPGLYGGTEDNARCNRLQLVEFLEANTVKGAAWAEVQGIRPDQIREFVDTLTPVVLLKDTRVTNHGFKDGRANPIQSVLQAGTAVLVDDTGMPRARCACGNPLNKPIPQSTVRYLGPAWDNFDPGNLQVVNPGPGTDTFVLQNLDGGRPFARPSGSDGESDFDAPSAAVNAIPGNIYVQQLLGDPSTTVRVGGQVTDGVIIKPLVVIDDQAPGDEDRVSPSGNGIRYVGSYNRTPRTGETFRSNFVDVTAGDYLTGEAELIIEGTDGGNFCVAMRIVMQGQDFPRNSQGEYSGPGEMSFANCDGSDAQVLALQIEVEIFQGTLTAIFEGGPHDITSFVGCEGDLPGDRQTCF